MKDLLQVRSKFSGDLVESDLVGFLLGENVFSQCGIVCVAL